MNDVNEPDQSKYAKTDNREPAVQWSACQYPQRGSLCPKCGQGILNYNGLLILTCLECGYQAPGGAFT